MPGLISREWLFLSFPHLLALIFNLALWQQSRLSFRAASCFSLALAACIGWGRFLTFDVMLTWNQLAAFDGRLIHLSDIAFLNHLKYQPPLWNWYLSAWPSYPLQQVQALAVSALNLGICWRLYGDAAARQIAATPLFLLMASQPMTGVYAVACLLAARVLWRDGLKLAAILAAFLASHFTYTAYAIYPLLVVEFGAYGTFLCLGVGMYWFTFALSDTRTYAVQWEFVVKMFTFGAILPDGVKSVSGVMARNSKRIDRNLLTLLSAGVYLFPAWWRVAWWGLLIGLLIAAGGGSVKYLALLAACLPPQREESENQ